MTGLVLDLRYALRQFLKTPGFTFLVIATLALGIGATTAIYSVLYATLIEPMPFPNPDQLVMVWSRTQDRPHVNVSTDDFLEWKRQNTVFQDLNALHAEPGFNLAGPERPERVRVHASTPGLFQMEGTPMMLGRNFLPEEGTAGNEHVTILTHSLWRRLGADSTIVGKQLRMDGEPYTVVGVFAPGPLDRIQFDLVVPLVFGPTQVNRYHWMLVMGRLKPGVSIAQAQAEMDVIARRLAKERPESNRDWGVGIEPLHNDFLPDTTKVMLWVLMVGVGFVLLIACVNVANLLLARSMVRQREAAVRVSLGASRRRVFAQFLTESLTLSLLGGVAGIVLAELLVKLLLMFLPRYTLPSEADVRISLPVLLFTVMVTMLAGIFFGCVPAWQGARVDLTRTLKEGGSGRSSPGRRRVLHTLVIAEFALAVTLLTAAGLSIRSFWKLVHVDYGARMDHVLTFTVPLPEQRFTTPEHQVAFYRELVDKIKSLPGVTTAQVSTAIPVEAKEWWGTDKQFVLLGGPASVSFQLQRMPKAAIQSVTPDYFETFGVEIIRGRRFTDQDTMSSTPVTIVNEEFVKRFLPNVDPLGKWIATQKFAPLSRTGPRALVQMQIIGVFRNVRNFGLRQEIAPEFDVPFWQNPWPQARMAVRTIGDPEALTKEIAATVASMQPDLPLADLKTMSEVVDDVLSHDRFSMVLHVAFGILALLLAALGIYSVMAFAVAQRTHEIALRMAVGAGYRHLITMILREGLVLAVRGLLLGLLGAYLAGAVLKSLLYGVGAIDLGALAIVASTLIAVAVLATYLPARRAAGMDPMLILRRE